MKFWNRKSKEELNRVIRKRYILTDCNIADTWSKFAIFDMQKDEVYPLGLESTMYEYEKDFQIEIRSDRRFVQSLVDVLNKIEDCDMDVKDTLLSLINKTLPED